ncbi:hypothetical protein TrispH2_005277 [Trichoplax sp. H2]|nr:hypothetical protein TrispH2_005277 [Trichoplax sp. H2]|eukprot:RDD42850.1 hypothetical protein TrispH2_005277 [Trichoplax sp. H2]
MMKIAVVAFALILTISSISINGYPLSRHSKQLNNVDYLINSKQKTSEAWNDRSSRDFNTKRMLEHDYVEKLKEELENLGLDSKLLDDEDVLQELTTTQAAPIICDENKGEIPFLFGCIQG